MGRALALALALGACSIDVGPLQSPSASGTESTPAPSQNTAGAAGSPASGGGNDADPARRPRPDPGEAPIETAGRTCGVAGLPCCNPGNKCDLGACLRGVCTPYGGFYARSPDCRASPCSSRNAYTAGCTCPWGFEDDLLWETYTSCDQDNPKLTEVHACRAGRTGELGFAGAWVKETHADTCAVDCVAPNPYTRDCGCPQGARALPITGDVSGATCSGATRTLALCARADGEPLNFGGFYALSSAAADGCAIPNPFTGGCSCPAADNQAPPPQTLQVGDQLVFVCNQ